MLENKKLLYITLVLENSNELKVDPKNISFISIRGLKENFSYREGTKEFSKNKSVERFDIILKEDANQIMNMDEHYREYGLPFDIIKEESNLAQVHFHFEDGSKDWFYAPWSGGDYKNDLQKTDYYMKDFRIIVDIDFENEEK